MVKCESLRINMFRITHTGKVSKFSRNTSRFQRKWKFFYQAVALRWNETRHEKHEEISRSSSRKKSVISSGDLTD